MIIGKHIPAGTGMKKYRNVALNTDVHLEKTIPLIMEDEADAAADDMDEEFRNDAEIEADTEIFAETPDREEETVLNEEV